MGLLLYTTFLKNGSILNDCSNIAGDGIGVEFAVQGQDLVGGLEYFTYATFEIKNSSGVVVHKWEKFYDHYLKAGLTYTFSSANNITLPSGTYTVEARFNYSGTDMGSKPLVSTSESLPMVM